MLVTFSNMSIVIVMNCHELLFCHVLFKQSLRDEVYSFYFLFHYLVKFAPEDDVP